MNESVLIYKKTNLKYDLKNQNGTHIKISKNNCKFLNVPQKDEKIDIIYEDEETLVVNKPSTMMIYPHGNFRLNTLKYILAKENGYNDVRNCHRIDKNTSGICIFGKGTFGTSKLMNIFEKEQDTIKKTYFAKVDGKFPPEDITCDLPLITNFYKNYTISNNKIPVDSVTKFQRDILNLRQIAKYS